MIETVKPRKQNIIVCAIEAKKFFNFIFMK